MSLSLRSIKDRSIGIGFIIKIVGLALMLVLHILLTNTMTTAVYGQYVLLISLLHFIGFLAVFGFENFLVKESAKLLEDKEIGELKGLWRFTLQFSLTSSISIGLIIQIVAFFLVPIEYRFSTSLLGVILPIFAIIQLVQAQLRGVQRILDCLWPIVVAQPILIMMIVGSLYVMSGQLVVEDAILSYAIVVVLIGILIYGLKLKYQKSIRFHQYSAILQPKQWRRQALVFFSINVFFMINSQADVIMLGLFDKEEQVAVFNIGNRIANLSGFLLVALNVALAPKIASLYQAKDMIKLQQLITKNIRLVFLFSIFGSLIFVLFGHWILTLFGVEYVTGYELMIVLIIGQLINVAVGPVGYVLSMTGHEKDVSIGMGISTVMNVILNAVLIPKYHAFGAAIATTTSLVMWNVLLYIKVRKRTGINPAII